MRISIRHNGDDIVEFNQFKVHGREAVGGYGFTFALQGSRKGCDNPMAIFDIRLSLALPGPTKPIINSILASTQIVQCPKFSNNSEQLHFETILTKEQINALEEYRQDKNLKLNIGLKALTSSNSVPIASYEHEDVILPREQWLQALKNAGFRQTILFEVPLPKDSNEFTTLYTKAQEFIETGHYQDAVMQCRRIIEHIESIRKDKSKSSAANKKAHGQERQGMTSIERLLSLREQLKNVCQLGAHGDESFTRSQAKSVLAMAMTLVSEPTVGMADQLD